MPAPMSAPLAASLARLASADVMKTEEATAPSSKTARMRRYRALRRDGLLLCGVVEKGVADVTMASSLFRSFRHSLPLACSDTEPRVRLDWV
jgi:hypothetical protein